MRKMENELIAQGPKAARKRAPMRFAPENTELEDTKELLTEPKNRRARTYKHENAKPYNWTSGESFIGKSAWNGWKNLEKEGLQYKTLHAKGGKRRTYRRSTHSRSTQRKRRV